ncbi:MAG: ATP-binding protein [Bacteroidales bacterium]|nr:ATP-binding protein [Bacteroidales bacterium]
MIERTLKEKLLYLATKYPFVLVTGPRQSGKSTLVKDAFPDYQYVSLEEMDNRKYASEDPRGFISTFPRKTIIDEVQRVPELLSYLQTHTDNEGEEGMYILTGSQNLLLLSSVDQSLAGRVGILTLLPFSHEEMSKGGIAPDSVNEEIFRGGYPRLYDKHIPAEEYYPNYIDTYVERDVRDIKAISNLSLFVKMIKLCAGRIGQLLNLSSLAVECGVTIPTISSWLSVLQASYIVYLLQPDHRNFSKRLVKTPKLYFYDTGLACSLLEINSARQVAFHYLRGGLFENMVINEFVKRCYGKGNRPSFTFWRDSNGREVDLLMNDGENVKAIEIKSGETYESGYFKNLKYWGVLSGTDSDNLNVVYAGDQLLRTSQGSLIPWEKITTWH